MNDITTTVGAQQILPNGQADEDNPFAPIYGEYETATEFLDSLGGRLAEERDKLRADGQDDEFVANRILALKAEADSLSFTAVPAGRSGVFSITATITKDVGDTALDVCKLDPSDVVKRIDFAQRLEALHPAIEEVDAEQQLMQLAAELAKRRTESQQNGKPAEPTSEMLLQQMPEAVRAEARAMLEDPQLMERIVADVQALGVAGERDLIRTLYLAGVSRLLARPLAIIIQSLSSSGKTFVAETTAKLFPPEVIIHATAMTAQALYYLPPGALEHKFVVAGERSRRQNDDVADATKALREMIGSGKLSKLLPVKEKDTGRYVTVRIEQPGPIAYCESTTASDIFDEDKNRCLLLSADERPEQTRRVLDRIAAAHSGAAAPDHDAIIGRHYALQRMLQQRPVWIPFAERLAKKFSEERVEARRAFGHLLSMIRAVALLYQYQRESDADGCIIATLADYEIAAELCWPSFARLLGGKLSDAAIRFHERLQEWVGEQFTTTEAKKADGKSRQVVYGWLEELASIDAVIQLEPGIGNKPAVWALTKMSHEAVAQGGFKLPMAAELENNEQPDSDSELEPEYSDDEPPF